MHVTFLSGSVESHLESYLCLQDKRGHIVADTLLPTQMFPLLPASATFVADTNFVSGTLKMFLILFRNILCPQQNNVSQFAQPKKHHGQQCVRNNVSSFARVLRLNCVTVSHDSLLTV